MLASALYVNFHLTLSTILPESHNPHSRNEETEAWRGYVTSELSSYGIMITSTQWLNCYGYSSIQGLFLKCLICVSLVLGKDASHLSIIVILSILTCCLTVPHFQLCSRPWEVAGNKADKNACPLNLYSRVSTWSSCCLY